MEFFKKIFQHSFTQVTIVIGGLAITIVNLYITSLISPIVQDIGSIAKRVEAVEQISATRTPLVERYIVTEAQVKILKEDIQEVKDTLIRIENKIDQLR